MVDCPHLEDCARIRRLIRPGGEGSLSRVECDENETLGGSTPSSVPNEESALSNGVGEDQEKLQPQQQPGTDDEGEDLWRCQTCQTKQSPWICIFCGSIGCGRYVNAHAKSHFEDLNSHAVCLELHSLAAFCYKCDEFVVNDSQDQALMTLRNDVQKIFRRSTAEEGGEEEEELEEQQQEERLEEEGADLEDFAEYEGEAKREPLESSPLPLSHHLLSSIINDSHVPFSSTTNVPVTTTLSSPSTPLSPARRRLPQINSSPFPSSSSSERRRSDRILLKFGPEKRRSARIGVAQKKNKNKKTSGHSKDVKSGAPINMQRNTVISRDANGRFIKPSTTAASALTTTSKFSSSSTLTIAKGGRGGIPTSNFYGSKSPEIAGRSPSFAKTMTTTTTKRDAVQVLSNGSKRPRQSTSSATINSNQQNGKETTFKKLRLSAAGRVRKERSKQEQRHNNFRLSSSVTTTTMTTENVLAVDASKMPIKTSNGSSRSSTPTTTASKNFIIANHKGNGRAGLRNLGNTCFMNAVLQSLSNIQQFCGYMKGLPELSLPAKKSNGKKAMALTRQSQSVRKNGGNNNNNNNNAKNGDGDFADEFLLAEELRKTLIALWQGDKPAISPQSLFQVIWRVVPQFRGYQQQDAHEFMRYLLDRLHSELLQLLPIPAPYGNSNTPSPRRRSLMESLCRPNGVRHNNNNNNEEDCWLSSAIKSRTSVVSLIFGGVLQNEVNCLTCGLESKKHDPFLDLSLDIPAKFQPKGSKLNNGRGGGRGGSLEALYSGSSDSTNQRRSNRGGTGPSNHVPTNQVPEDRGTNGGPATPSSSSPLSSRSVTPSLNGDEKGAGDDPLSVTTKAPSSISVESIPVQIGQSTNGAISASSSSSSSSSLSSKTATASTNQNSTTSSSSSSAKTPCTLADCFESFIALEHLGDSELYFCPTCKKRQRSTKKFWLRRAPSVLCVHLKRFRWANFSRQKVDTYVDFPVKGLDLSDYMLSNLHGTRGSGRDNVYDLAAVIVHHGSGVGCGHYTAYAIHDGQWFHFNDSTVTPTDATTVAKCKAYILFYIKRDERGQGL